MMRNTVFIIAVSLLAAACESMLPEKIDVVHLGVVRDSTVRADGGVVVPATEGSAGVRIIADRDYSYEILSGSDWLRKGLAKGDTLSFSFSANGGFRRSAKIRIAADGREDFLLVKQKGTYSEALTLSEHNVAAPADGGPVQLRVLSNLPSDYFTASASDSQAIASLFLQSYMLSFTVLPTPIRDVRSVSVKVSCTDGWGDELSDTVVITQAGNE